MHTRVTHDNAFCRKVFFQIATVAHTCTLYGTMPKPALKMPSAAFASERSVAFCSFSNINCARTALRFAFSQTALIAHTHTLYSCLKEASTCPPRVIFAPHCLPCILRRLSFSRSKAVVARNFACRAFIAPQNALAASDDITILLFLPAKRLLLV